MTSDQVDEFKENKIRVRILGEKQLFPRRIQETFEEIENETKYYKKRVLNLAIGYSGRREILNAIKKIKNKISLRELEKNLYINKDIDLIIRTGGYQRLSGFMLWQSAYSELFFLKKLWPEITIKDIKEILDLFSKTQRNFGK